MVQEKPIEQIEQKKKKGGARPNSGPKKGAKYRKTRRKEISQNYLISRVEEEIEPIVTALIEKAKQKDIMAIREALDRAWGKAKEKHDVTVNLPTPLDNVYQIERLPSHKELKEED